MSLDALIAKLPTMTTQEKLALCETEEQNIRAIKRSCNNPDHDHIQTLKALTFCHIRLELIEDSL